MGDPSHMDLVTLLDSTNLVWLVDGDDDLHYVDLLNPIEGSAAYRIAVRKHSFSVLPSDRVTYYKISFGAFCTRHRFDDLEVAKREAIKFAARLLLEALGNLNSDVTKPYHGDIDFEFLGIPLKEIQPSPTMPGWKSGPIHAVNYPRAKKALEQAGFKVDQGVNAEGQMWIWWGP